MDIFLIDAIGPFFRGYQKRRINWSKIPFDHFHENPKKRSEQFQQIRLDMRTFVSKVSGIGFNSVSLDDVAHLVPDPWYEPEINTIIAQFQEEYRRIFQIIIGAGMAIYLNMDVLTYAPGLRENIKNCPDRAEIFLSRQIETLFATFPEIKGVIMRIGECDGKDVKGIFKSELLLRSAKQVNSMLHTLLPLFEKHGRTLILRTWTVGAYGVGDLIWHRRTTGRVLRAIDSPNFILSMKYGESDFFRYLPLNRNFFRFKVKKMIELQGRREYEGCGEFPSFIGWDYRKYADQLRDTGNIVGISVWCQTGGWLPFRRLTYLEPAGVWNELNVFVTVKVFQEDLSVEEAVTAFCKEKGWARFELFIEFLRLNDEVIKELLYIPEIAQRKLFFRRVRIPPLLTVFWNNIFINHSVRKILRSLVASPEQCVAEGYAALEKIEKMHGIGGELGLPVEDIRFMAETFFLLALARHYYFEPFSEDVRKQLKEAKKRYKKQYPKGTRPRYRVKTSYKPFPLRRRHLAILLRFALREKRGYRLVDYLFTLHVLGLVFRCIVFARPKIVPKFARKHAMGIETIFR